MKMKVLFRFLQIRKLDKLLFRMYIGPLILTFFIALFVLLMQFLWKYIDDLVGKGLDFWTIGQLLFYASATFVPMALPIAILLSSLMTFGTFGEHYELAASKSVGVSLLKMMRPLIFLSVFISVSAFYFSNNILPVVNLKMSTLLYDVTNAKPALNIREGIFYREIDNVVIKVARKEKDGKTIRNVIIYDHSKYTGNTSVTIAETGHMEMTEDEQFLILRLYNGFSYNEPLESREHYDNRPVERVHFREQFRRFDLSSFAMQKTNEDFFKDHYQMMSIGQLNESIDSMNIEKERRNEIFAGQIISFWHFYSQLDSASFHSYIPEEETHIDYDHFLTNFSPEDRSFILENALRSAQNALEIHGYQGFELDSLNKHFLRFNVEFHRKFTLSVACLILFFIGAPLGAIIRKGGLGLPLVVAILIFVFYYILSITGEKFVREGVWNPVFGMWLSSIVLFPFGMWLTLKTINDSPLMDAESWHKFSVKTGNFIRKIVKRKK
jgi:lipopolysaccharide export system permease protein